MLIEIDTIFIFFLQYYKKKYIICNNYRKRQGRYAMRKPIYKCTEFKDLKDMLDAVAIANQKGLTVDELVTKNRKGRR